MLKWCSAACAVTQHNLKMNVHPVSLPVADCHRLAISTTCLFSSSGGGSGKHEFRRSQNTSRVRTRQMRNSAPTSS